MASEKTIQLTDAEFEAKVLKSEKPVLVDFWAQWCAPCRTLAPVVDELAAAFDGKVVVGKLNVDENPNTAARYGVRSIPTLLLFKNGQAVDQRIGVVPKGQLESMIKSNL